MVKKSITIPEYIYEAVKEEDNFSGLVTELLAEHIRRKSIDSAKLSFGSCDYGMSGVDYVNTMRAEGTKEF